MIKEIIRKHVIEEVVAKIDEFVEDGIDLTISEVDELIEDIIDKVLEEAEDYLDARRVSLINRVRGWIGI
jgi:division protein CdvB (Snf7/Vps24/ESCRT-III family)